MNNKDPFDEYYKSLGYSYGKAHYEELRRCWEAAIAYKEKDASNLEI